MSRMTKSLVLAIAIAVATIAPAGGAPAGRRETITYERASGIHVANVVWAELALDNLPEVAPRPREKTVSVEIVDDSGRPVEAVVHQGDKELGRFCGETEAPLELASREPVHIHVYSGPGCADVSTATSGSITFTFAK